MNIRFADESDTKSFTRLMNKAFEAYKHEIPQSSALE
ncbi:hypothetical protein J2S19_001368 [Metabacillus malikii]|uniref:GNAT family N-acetyltransferase n=1 Tax=Metabacillus malikii TaxID=1504265 RepID=A0ABT9ZCY3_9BACI|nr:hypothetical protein [Metabacillus malikii]